jgi:hypothetical protein
MERKLTTINPFYAATAAMLTVTAVVAGCGGGTKSAAGQPSGSTRQAVSGKTAEDSLAKSHLRVLTRLRRSQLCHVLSTAEAVGILHARTARPVYTSHPGVAVTCQWIKRGQGRASGAQLYVGISASINWTGTQAVDRSLHSKPVTIDGHPGLAATRRGTVVWAQVDVALGGGDDPVAEYRAPTMAAAQALARAATPHIIALG